MAVVALILLAAVSHLQGLRALPLLLLLSVLILFNKATGLYDRDEHLLRKTTLEEAPALLQVSTLFCLAVWLSGDFLVDRPLGRTAVLALGVVTFVAMLLGRAAVRVLVRVLAPPERCIIVGDESAASRVAAKLGAAPSVKVHVVGRVALSEGAPARSDKASLNGMRMLGELEGLGLVLASHDVERAIITPGVANSDQMLHAIRLVKALGVKVSVAPRLLEAVGSSAAYDDVEGTTLLGVRREGLNRSSEALKRALDVLGASIATLLLGPLFVVIAAAIKLDSRGAIFFDQMRIGRQGRAFSMYKFRSMVQDAESMKHELRGLNETDGLFKIADDPRITRVGALLRRTSLDELPQLINVLKGDMSLVGPRPLVPDEDAQIQGWERRRLVLRPGMTGLWQIFGSARIPMNEMVQIDYLYGANWSLWQDIKILLRTMPYVLSRRGM